MNKLTKVLAAGLLIAVTALTAAGCGTASADNSVVIYSNADDEALTAMENALTAGGYEGQYIIQSFATSELGGRMMAEGSKIEADLVTMSTYYLDTAQKESGMFSDLSFDHATLSGDCPSYSSPITAQEGAVMVNTEVMREQGLSAPASIKDLADPKYAGQVSIPDIEGSSTGWILVWIFYKNTRSFQKNASLTNNGECRIENDDESKVRIILGKKPNAKLRIKRTNLTINQFCCAKLNLHSPFSILNFQFNFIKLMLNIKL